jgi:hypothetical protein
LHRRERGGESSGALPRGEGLQAGRFDRFRHCRRTAAQRHQPLRKRSRGDTRQRLLRDEHDLQQQRRLCREHARTIARHGWRRQDIRYYLWAHSGNKWKDLYGNNRYGKVYNRNLPVWYKREPEARTPIVPSPDNIHLFVAGGEAGRFSAFIPGWGHMSSPVLRALGDTVQSSAGPRCVDGTCYL